MAGINEDRNRQVVPLWRTFTATASRGELASVKAADAKFSDDMIAELKREWEENPILPVATDLVSSALTLGRFEVAGDAARSVLLDASATESAREVAELYLRRGRGGAPKGGGAFGGSEGEVAPDPSRQLRQRLQEGVSQARRQLIAYPLNPMLWSNLALLYTSLGVHEKATRAMRNALMLAPENRFVLRAGSRFYLHIGDRHRAHRLLADNPALVKADPWLLSAEIATASAVGKTSSNIKAARRMLGSERQPPFHVSELASAVGTLESFNGNMKSAKSLVTLSLREPSENSIAQAAWLHRTFGGVGIEEGSTRSPEANAWFAWRAARWGVALDCAKQWLVEQPFSSRPAMLGSHLASVVMEDYSEAAALARQGMLSNAADFALQNSLAFSLARSGDATGAARAFREVDERRLTSQQLVVWMATRGLIAFRLGDLSAGRQLYTEAISLGERLRDEIAAYARLCYAFEELRVKSAIAEAVRKEAIDGAASMTEPSHLLVLDRLKKYKPH